MFWWAVRVAGTCHAEPSGSRDAGLLKSPVTYLWAREHITLRTAASAGAPITRPGSAGTGFLLFGSASSDQQADGHDPCDQRGGQHPLDQMAAGYG